jgi:hypothetical protein
MSDAETPPLSDTLADEATPKPRPEGTPGLWPFLHLPRRAKADFFAAIRRFPDDGKITGDTTAELAANAMSLAADVEDALRIVARDSEVFKAWIKTATDEDLFGLFGWYMERYQVGEAVPSPS